VTGPRLKVIVWDRAARQIEEANSWWRTHRQGSPEALSDEVVRAFELISRQPGVGAAAEAARLAGVRRLLLRRVGYFLHYRVETRKEEVQVLAFWHARRGTGPLT
jgi:plasmid stabilization system protein ParE